MSFSVDITAVEKYSINSRLPKQMNTFWCFPRPPFTWEECFFADLLGEVKWRVSHEVEDKKKKFDIKTGWVESRWQIWRWHVCVSQPKWVLDWKAAEYFRALKPSLGNQQKNRKLLFHSAIIMRGTHDNGGMSDLQLQITCHMNLDGRNFYASEAATPQKKNNIREMGISTLISRTSYEQISTQRKNFSVMSTYKDWSDYHCCANMWTRISSCRDFS